VFSPCAFFGHSRYHDTTSPWTLDYPPLFAWFEWALAQIAAHVDPKMLDVRALEYASNATVAFQRGSVSVTGLLLAAAAYHAVPASAKPATGGLLGPVDTHLVAFILLLANAGLFMVDNVHFQYNGMLLGGQPTLRK
jgi:alpha-1,3-glucosyltransferase